MDNERIDQFIRAFKTDGGFCRYTCNCGKTYYNSFDETITWDDGELEELEADPNASGVDFSLGIMDMEGKEFVDACDCWHKSAENVMQFMDTYAHQIARYLTSEKKRKQEEADRSPIVE